MPITYRSIKNYLIIFLIASLVHLNAQEKVEDTAVKHLDTLVTNIKQALTSDTLAAAERNQLYDILGSLGICRPVMQTVLEQSTDQTHVSATTISNPTPHPDEAQSSLNHNTQHTPDIAHDVIPAQPVSSMDAILSKFDTLKQHLVQQLADHKIEPAHLESAYTLVGSINLCRPILKGADLLSEKMKAETSKDQPTSTPALEPSSPISNFPASSDTATSITS